MIYSRLIVICMAFGLVGCLPGKDLFNVSWQDTGPRSVSIFDNPRAVKLQYIGDGNITITKVIINRTESCTMATMGSKTLGNGGMAIVIANPVCGDPTHVEIYTDRGNHGYTF